MRRGPEDPVASARQGLLSSPEDPYAQRRYAQVLSRIGRRRDAARVLEGRWLEDEREADWRRRIRSFERRVILRGVQRGIYQTKFTESGDRAGILQRVRLGAEDDESLAARTRVIVLDCRDGRVLCDEWHRGITTLHATSETLLLASPFGRHVWRPGLEKFLNQGELEGFEVSGTSGDVLTIRRPGSDELSSWPPLEPLGRAPTVVAARIQVFPEYALCIAVNRDGVLAGDLRDGRFVRAPHMGSRLLACCAHQPRVALCDNDGTVWLLSGLRPQDWGSARQLPGVKLRRWDLAAASFRATGDGLRLFVDGVPRLYDLGGDGFSSREASGIGVRGIAAGVPPSGPGAGACWHPEADVVAMRRLNEGGAQPPGFELRGADGEVLCPLRGLEFSCFDPSGRRMLCIRELESDRQRVEIWSVADSNP